MCGDSTWEGVEFQESMTGEGALLALVIHAGRTGQSPRHPFREGIALMLSAAPPVALGESQTWNTW